jgi:hypothetical protein
MDDWLPPYAESGQHAWQLAEQLLGQLSTCQLKLFEVLGVSPRAMLVLAQAQELSEDVSDALYALFDVFAVCSHRMQSQPNSVPQMSVAQRQLVCELYLLLPTVVLPCAMHGTQDPDSGLAAGAELALCLLCLDFWGWLSVAPAGATPWLAPKPPGVWLCEMLACILQLTDHWLQLAAAKLEAPNMPCPASTSDEGTGAKVYVGVNAIDHAARSLRLLCCVLAHCCPKDSEDACLTHSCNTTQSDSLSAGSQTAAAPKTAAAAAADVATAQGWLMTSK